MTAVLAGPKSERHFGVAVGVVSFFTCRKATSICVHSLIPNDFASIVECFAVTMLLSYVLAQPVSPHKRGHPDTRTIALQLRCTSRVCMATPGFKGPGAKFA